MYKLSLPFTLLLLTISYIYAQDATSQNPNQAGVPPSKASLIFNSDSVVVDPGERLQLDCGVEGNYRYCFWEKEGEQQSHTLQVEDVHGGYIKGLSKPDSIKGNECGIVINSVSANDHGVWTCKVFVFAKTLEGSKRVIVTVKPQLPTLDVNESPLVVSEDELKEVTCTVPAARPPAQIRWFVGTEDITTHSSGENVPTDDKGTYRSASTLRYKFQPRFDRELLKCTIEHPTLQEPERAEVPLDVRFKPYAISSTQIYGIPVAEEYEIKFNFTSNPLPDMRWYVNEGEIPVPGEIGRYMAGIKNLRDNVYMATLRIRDFTSEDVGVVYKLTAKNDLGEKTFDVTLSTGPAPPGTHFSGYGGIEGSSSSEVVAAEGHVEFEDTIGSGTIAAIIVIVVFILILLFIIGMMRYRQMYCFGPKDRIKNHLKESGENLRDEHDTESAREPNTGVAPTGKTKASNLLRNFTSMVKPKKSQKEPRLDKIEEGEAKGEKNGGNEETKDGKSNTPSEIVYAELELNKNKEEMGSKDGSKRSPDFTEYAEIVGTVPDNKEIEKKE
ncbi:UNVERIFIED_CONTAM: hypothetical protein RMT77_012865 [Armadillidium vulgare]